VGTVEAAVRLGNRCDGNSEGDRRIIMTRKLTILALKGNQETCTTVKQWFEQARTQQFEA